MTRHVFLALMLSCSKFTTILAFTTSRTNWTKSDGVQSPVVLKPYAEYSLKITWYKFRFHRGRLMYVLISDVKLKWP